jgi:ADP-ribosylglycohydrolase
MFDDNSVYLQNKRNVTMGKVKMLGALAGDIIGSPYEFYNTKSTDFELFTKQYIRGRVSVSLRCKKSDV